MDENKSFMYTAIMTIGQTRKISLNCKKVALDQAFLDSIN